MVTKKNRNKVDIVRPKPIATNSLATRAVGGDRGSAVHHECVIVLNHNPKTGVYLVQTVPNAQWELVDERELRQIEMPASA
jgi:hypothetical protein